ncbi:hypothetical protein chiPu_0003318 [Chiloscyllium punctatum]|uniref:Uncharacterized protein n=1 Tax=Chiloscyllium punctatum TaxID=137246 RepID=A0A401S3C1_CHIPU|nr:hypothetical protein [Chiloscyllium punctatum]
MAKGTSIPTSSFGLEYWLNKAVEWGQTTTFQSQQDVCLHLPKLQEFLKQIYGAIQHMSTTSALKSFPLIGQLLGRLCWNPFVVADGKFIKIFRQNCFSSEAIYELEA